MLFSEEDKQAVHLW